MVISLIPMLANIPSFHVIFCFLRIFSPMDSQLKTSLLKVNPLFSWYAQTIKVWFLQFLELWILFLTFLCLIILFYIHKGNCRDLWRKGTHKHTETYLKYFNSYRRLSQSSLNSTYDDNFSAMGLKSFTRQLFLCTNVLKLWIPWYAPIPLCPTPPNGSVSTVTSDIKLNVSWLNSRTEIFHQVLTIWEILLTVLEE